MYSWGAQVGGVAEGGFVPTPVAGFRGVCVCMVAVGMCLPCSDLRRPAVSVVLHGDA